jgi:hypothetical protein
MDVLYDRFAAIDVGKKEFVVCVGLPSAREGGERRQEVRTYGTLRRDLLELRDWLTEESVGEVAMGATGQCWRGAFYLLEEAVDVVLVDVRAGVAAA